MFIAPELAAVVAASWLAAVSGYTSWYGRRGVRWRKLADEGALLLDVRTPAEFAAHHAPGSANVPAAELEVRQSEIGAHSRPVLVYGRTRTSTMLAAQRLRTLGFHEIVTVGTLAQCERHLGAVAAERLPA